MTLVLAFAPACRVIIPPPDRVIALEIANTSPRLAVGDTLRMTARALNAAGNPVPEAEVTWAVVDTGAVGFLLSPAGLITGTAQGTGRIQASSGTLRSDPITVTVTAPSPSAAQRRSDR